MRRHHELPFGAETSGDRPSGVRFRLWAPRAADVSLVLDGSEAAAGPDAAGAGRVVVGDDRPRRRRLALSLSRRRRRLSRPGLALSAGRRARRRARSSIPAPIDWTDTGWRGRAWEEMVIYELHLGTFSESGDFAGAIAQLDHLVALGVTAVELMPIAAVPGAAQLGL